MTRRLMHRPIFRQRVIMQDAVGENLTIDLVVEAELHPAGIWARRDGAGLTARSEVEHIVELEVVRNVASRAVMQWEGFGVDKIVGTVEDIRVKPDIFYIAQISYPSSDIRTCLYF